MTKTNTSREHVQSDPRDLWPLRDMIRVMQGHDLTKKRQWQRQWQRQRQRQWQRQWQRQSQRLVTFETVITILTWEISNRNTCAIKRIAYCELLSAYQCIRSYSIAIAMQVTKLIARRKGYEKNKRFFMPYAEEKNNIHKNKKDAQKVILKMR